MNRKILSSICLENKQGLFTPQYNQMSLFVAGRLGITNYYSKHY